MNDLKKQLNHAVETEDFEKAAELRDRINGMEKELETLSQASD